MLINDVMMWYGNILLLIQDCLKFYEFSLIFKLKCLVLFNGELLSFRMFYVIFGMSLFMVFNVGVVKCIMYGVVMNIWEVFNMIVMDQDYGVFLQVVIFIIDVGSYFEIVSQMNMVYFMQCGVWFVRSGSIYMSIYVMFLWVCFQCRYVVFCNFVSMWFVYQLVNCCY